MPYPQVSGASCDAVDYNKPIEAYLKDFNDLNIVQDQEITNIADMVLVKMMADPNVYVSDLDRKSIEQSGDHYRSTEIYTKILEIVSNNVLSKYWYFHINSKYLNVPLDFEDASKLNQIIDKLNNQKQISSKESKLFTGYACFELKYLKKKLNSGEILSESEKINFYKYGSWTLNRLNALKKIRGSELNSSELDEFSLLLESRKKNSAPIVTRTGQKSDYKTKEPHAKNEIDEMDPAIALAINNTEANKAKSLPALGESDCRKSEVKKKVKFSDDALIREREKEKNAEISRVLSSKRPSSSFYPYGGHF